MAEFPSMPMFWDAYMADTSHLSLEEHGAYQLILGHMWLNRGAVPDDDQDNARRLRVSVAKWRKLKARLTPPLIFFGPENDRKITQKRLQIEWNVVADFRDRQRQKGRRSGEVRREKKQTLNGSRSSSPVHPAVRTETPTETEPEANPERTPNPNKSKITSSSVKSREAVSSSPLLDTATMRRAAAKVPDSDSLDVPDFLVRRKGE